MAQGETDEEGTDSVKEALCKHFEPASKWELYSVQCQSKKQRPDEPWADFADNLLVLADRTFLELQEEAQEKLSLDQFFWEVHDKSGGICMCQIKPKTLDDMVVRTRELESNLKGKPALVAAVTGEETRAAAVRTCQDQVMEMLQSIVEYMDRVEASAVSHGVTKELDQKPTGKLRCPMVCYNCIQEGHFAKGCAASHRSGPLGN